MSNTNDIFDDSLEEGVKTALGSFLAQSPLGKVLFYIVALFLFFGIGIVSRDNPQEFIWAPIVAVGATIYSMSGWKDISSSLARFMRICMLILASAALLTGLYIGFVHIPTDDYNRAIAYMEKGDYAQAKKCFKLLEDFKDSKEKGIECEEGIKYMHTYNQALSYMQKGHYAQAKMIFDSLGSFRDSEEKALECTEHLHQP